MTTPDDVETTARYLAGDDLDAAPRPDLDRIKRLLGDGSTWQQPRPELVESILDRITTDNGSRPAVPAAPTRVRARAGRRWVLPVAGGVSAAAAAALVVGLVVVNDNADPPAVETEVASHLILSGTDLAPTASATADVMETPSGVAVLLHIEGLAPAPEGFYYQAWVKGPAGLVAVGTFHLREPATDPIELWSGVNPTQYPTLTITLEPEDNNPASSGQRVLTSP